MVHSIDALRLGDFRAELGLGKDFAGFERIVFNNPLIEGCEKPSSSSSSLLSLQVLEGP